MSDFDIREPECKCSFCGKNQDDVEKLIAGPDVYICDECIELCNEIVQEEDETIGSSTDDMDFKPESLKPKEIKEYLEMVFSENSPGCQVLVAREGKVLIKEAYGLADISTKRKLTGNEQGGLMVCHRVGAGEYTTSFPVKTF